MINLKTSKPANFFFFVYTLSNWHFTCREEYRIAWLEGLDITDEKQSALDNLSQIFKKYETEQKLLSTYFFTEPERLYLETDILTKSEQKKINSLLALFAGDFEKFWNKEQDALYRILNWLKKEMRNGMYNDIYRKLLQFLGVRSDTAFDVIVLKPPSQVGNKGGGTALSSGLITIEIPTLAYAKQAGFVVLHEIAHMLARKSDILRNINTRDLNIPESFYGRGKEALLEEFLILSLLPRGYFNLSPQGAEALIVTDRKDWLNLSNYIIKYMYKENDNYIKLGAKIDTSYMRVYTKTLEQFFT